MSKCLDDVMCNFQDDENNCINLGIECAYRDNSGIDLSPLKNQPNKTIDIKIFEKYQKCINRIEDYLEYRFQNDDPEKIKMIIMLFIDSMTSELKNYKPNTLEKFDGCIEQSLPEDVIIDDNDYWDTLEVDCEEHQSEW